MVRASFHSLSCDQTPSTSLYLGRFWAQMVYKLRCKNRIEIAQSVGFNLLIVTVSCMWIQKFIVSY